MEAIKPTASAYRAGRHNFLQDVSTRQVYASRFIKLEIKKAYSGPAYFAYQSAPRFGHFTVFEYRLEIRNPSDLGCLDNGTELVILMTTAHPCLQLPRRKVSRLPYLHPEAEAAVCMLERLVADVGP